MILKPPLFAKPIHGHPLGPDGGLAAMWPMNEGRYNSTFNKVFDVSGNGNTGTLVADTHWVPGKFGPVLDFDGAGDGVNIGKPLITTDFTVSAWFQVRDDTIVHTIVSQYLSAQAGRALYLYYDGVNTDAIGITTNGGSQMAKYAISLNTWYHACVTRSGAAISLYVDGTLRDTASDGTASYQGSMMIGNDLSGFGNTDGQIDNVLIYTRALSASEIALLYLNTFCMFEYDPIELWSAATLGAAPPVGNAGIMTPWGGYWGPTY